MGNVVAMMGMSIDGFIEGPDHDISWHRVDEELHQFMNDEVRQFGALLEGRRTFELMDEFWPSADEDPDAPDAIVEFAQIWREIPKYVYSTTLTEVADPTATVIRSVEPSDVRALQARYDGPLGVGGSHLLDTFRRLGLVDEYWVHVHPVVVGGGTPLFSTPSEQEALELTGTRIFGNGVVLLRYRKLDTPD